MYYLSEFEHNIRNTISTSEIIDLDKLVPPLVQVVADETLFCRAEEALRALARLQRRLNIAQPEDHRVHDFQILGGIVRPVLHQACDHDPEVVVINLDHARLHA